MENGQYVNTILERLGRRYGRDLTTGLIHHGMTELFVAVFLSPQCTDKQVNKVTPALFDRYRRFDDYAKADLRELNGYLSGLNYYKTKARNLKRSAAIITGRFGGRVPDTLGELMELPGVGRKVANVVLNVWYKRDEGIAVDTHCARVSRRLGLSRRADPHKIEADLMRKVPKDEWGKISNLFIALGRDVCKARARQCYGCVLNDICPSSNVRRR